MSHDYKKNTTSNVLLEYKNTVHAHKKDYKYFSRNIKEALTAIGGLMSCILLAGRIVVGPFA